MYGRIPLMNWFLCKNPSIQFLNMKLWIAENFLENLGENMVRPCALKWPSWGRPKIAAEQLTL